MCLKKRCKAGEVGFLSFGSAFVSFVLNSCLKTGEGDVVAQLHDGEVGGQIGSGGVVLVYEVSVPGPVFLASGAPVGDGVGEVGDFEFGIFALLSEPGENVGVRGTVPEDIREGIGGEAEEFEDGAVDAGVFTVPVVPQRVA